MTPMADAQEGSFVLIPGAGGMAWYGGLVGEHGCGTGARSGCKERWLQRRVRRADLLLARCPGSGLA